MGFHPSVETNLLRVGCSLARRKCPFCHLRFLWLKPSRRSSPRNLETTWLPMDSP